IDSTCCFTAEFSIVEAYEVVACSCLVNLSDEDAMPKPPPPAPPEIPGAEPDAGPPVAVVGGATFSTKLSLAVFTSSQTFCWSASTIAFLRTLGCAMTDACVSNFPDVSTHRPGSTQKTARSTGSLSGATIRSFPTQSVLLASGYDSPASKINGNLELFTSTRRFTSAPWTYPCACGCRTSCRVHSQPPLLPLRRI